MMLFLGVFSFALFFLGDLNDAFFRKKALKPCFFAGFVTLTIATALRLAPKVGAELLICIPALIFARLLYKALFGAFPVKPAYTDAEAEKKTVSSGVYALCRHPGVLFFAGLYICLVPALGLPLVDCVLYIALDFLLAWAEDALIFPRSLKGYDEYKKAVPFIIPNSRSIKNCLSSMDVHK